MKRRVALLVGLVVALCSLQSCDSVLGLFQPLIGTWESSPDTFQFKAATFEWSSNTSTSTASGDYSVSGDQLEFDGSFSSGALLKVTLTYSIDGDSLYLTNSSGTTVSYTKK